jgi:3-hydroxyisobutyrate dehydrogenase-like beta-hydroxyacid dehydrogenase
MKVGFIGLGQMGAAMASSLVRAGHELTVYNRSPEKARPLIGLGVRAVDRIADACKADLIFTMLADDRAVESVTWGEGGLISNLAPGAIHISSTTISVSLADRLEESHAKAGQGFVSAPVFGRPEAAAAGKLFVVAAGPNAQLERARPVLEALGQRLSRLSERPRDANLLKLSGNFLITAVIEALGEALALLEKGGVDRRQCLDFLTSTLFDAPVYRIYGNLLLERKFTPAGFAAPLGQKDVRLVLAAAEDLAVPLPIASLVRDRFLRLLALGGEHLDWSAFGDLPAIDAGTHRTDVP